MDLVTDEAVLLGDIPDYVSLPGLFKASPVEEGGARFIFLEASNETKDRQGEKLLAKALADSQEYFLRHGNIDLHHYTILGPKLGIPNYHDYEIGTPRAVHIDGARTFVKAELYRGDSAMAKNAALVWDSLTKQQPPARWYPSVGGSVLAKSMQFDAASNSRVAVIDKVRWNNIALDRQPVNSEVPEASVRPIGTFAKALDGWVMAKTLTAGYGTDSATFTGGAALREQSLDGAMHDYFGRRNQLADAIRAGEAGKQPRAADLARLAGKKFGLSADAAAEFTERFMRDLSAGISNGRSK